MKKTSCGGHAVVSKDKLMSYSLESMSMLPHMSKRTLHVWLNYGVCNWEMILDYLGWPSVIGKVLIRGKQEGQSHKRKCEDGNRGWSDVIWWSHKPRNEGGLQKLERGGNRFSPGNRQKEHSLVTSWFEDLWPLNCKIIHLGGFKSLKCGNLL